MLTFSKSFIPATSSHVHNLLSCISPQQRSGIKIGGLCGPLPPFQGFSPHFLAFLATLNSGLRLFNSMMTAFCLSYIYNIPLEVDVSSKSDLINVDKYVFHPGWFPSFKVCISIPVPAYFQSPSHRIVLLKSFAQLFIGLFSYS